MSTNESHIVRKVSLPGKMADNFTGDNRITLKMFERNRSVWHEHISRSRAFIQQSMAGIQGRALILGAGNALEIPLSQIADQFDEVTIVEIDETSIRGAVNQLTPKQSSKIQIVIDDLTGVADSSAKAIQKTRNNSGSADDFKEEATKIIQSLKPVVYSLESKYQFVCSSLLLSQLAAFIPGYVQDILLERYKVEDASFLCRNNALAEWIYRVYSAHVFLLENAVDSEGRIYFSDSFTDHKTVVSKNGIEVLSKFADIVDGKILRKLFDPRFTTLENKNWYWHRLQPSHQAFGDAFGIEAYCLKSR